MPSLTSPLLKRLALLSGDILATAAALALALLVRHGGRPESTLLELYIFAAPFLIGLWVTGFLMFGLYDLGAARNSRIFFERLGRALILNGLVTFVLFHLIPEFRLTPRVTMALIFAAAAVFISGWRGLYNFILAWMVKDRVLFLGVSGEALEVGRYLNSNPQLGYQPVLGLRLAEDETAQDPGGAIEVQRLEIGRLAVIVRERNITTVVISAQIKTNSFLMNMLFTLVPLGVAVVELPRFYERILGKVPVSLIGEVWFLENLIGQQRPHYEFLKRILDLSTSAIIAVLALPAAPFIALAIMLARPGEVINYRRLRAHTGDGIIFFRQKRTGRNGSLFGFIKFRSQVLGAEKLGREKSDAPDPRAYPVGTFLRRTYLDELPQIWNVIKGEMSFIGPRPERPEFVRELEKKIPFYRIRELVLPGITGWAQLNMQNDASVSDAPEKLQYDLYYIKNRSTFLDMIILLKTTLKLLQRSGR